MTTNKPTSNTPINHTSHTARWEMILGYTADYESGSQSQDAPSGKSAEQGEADQGEQGTQPAPSGAGQDIDQLLDELYGDNKSRRGDLSDAQPDIARQLGDIRRFFPESVAQVLQKDLLQKSNLRKLLADPELFEHIEPDIGLVAQILSLRRAMPVKTKETAKQVVRRLIDELVQKMKPLLEQAVRGALHRPTRNRRPRYKEINWGRTIQKNLKHYQPRYSTIVPETLVGYGRQQRGLRDLILAVDTSGSMSTSVVYAGVYASVLASLPALKTRLVLFSTAVVDVTDNLQDPVDLLFGIQLRGGTNIEKAIAYCEQHISRPEDSTLILISDLFEGGDKAALVKRIATLVERGVQVIVLLALNDSGTPRFDREIAHQLVAFGVPSFACTPDQFADLMGTVLNGRDITHWAAGAGVISTPHN